MNINPDEIRELKSNKGKWNIIFYDGYKFIHQNSKDVTHYYVCEKYFDRKCPCRLIKKGENYSIRGVHIHPGNAVARPRTEVLSTLKEKAKTDRSKASVLIGSVVGTVNSQVAVSLPPNSQLSRTCNRVRNKDNIVIPKNVKRIEISNQYTVTKKGECFLLFDNGSEDDRLLIFGTRDNLRVLKNCSNIYCDGTFDITPPGFDQLYSVHGNYLLLLFQNSDELKKQFNQFRAVQKLVYTIDLRSHDE